MSRPETVEGRVQWGHGRCGGSLKAHNAPQRRHAHACPIREKRLRDLKGVRALVQGLRSIDDSPVSIAFLGKSVKWRRSEMGDLQRCERTTLRSQSQKAQLFSTGTA